MSGTIGFEVGHKLLLLREHGFQGVQLRLQLLNGDLGLALRSSRVLEISRGDGDQKICRFNFKEYKNCQFKSCWVEHLSGDPGAELAHIAIEFVPALHQGGHPAS